MSAPAGWFPDPGIGPGAVRYWDGQAWTDQIQFAPPPPGHPVANRPPLADYGSRLGGFLIDWLIVSVVSVPLIIIFHAYEHTTTTYNGNGIYAHNTSFNIGLEGIFIHAAIVLLYGMLFCGSQRGQTIGMRVTGNKVVDIATRQSIGYLRALGRAALEYLFAFLLLVPWILDMLSPLWSSHNQTWHDSITRSIVVKGTAIQTM